jgi:phospho-N-acetylmuramoyl-pentapeptide-transferase
MNAVAGWGIAAVTALFTGILEGQWIRLVRKWEVRQVEKSYGLSTHLERKSGTPTMGGVVFPVVLCLCLIPFGNLSWETVPGLLGLPVGAFAVGFTDDWLKFSKRSSEGLKSLEKFALQLFVALPWSAYVLLVNRVELFPGISLGPLPAIALLVFCSVGMMNAVNVTDGLDGLAAGASGLSFAALALLPLARPEGFGTASFVGAGICAGFLWHNAHPARVFMGDCGSHFLGGLLVSLCVSGGGLLLLVPFGFLFGVEIVSVAVQIVAIRGFGRKVFRMSPLHHHFELLGWQETQVVVRFWLVHAAGMIAAGFFLKKAMEAWG